MESQKERIKILIVVFQAGMTLFIGIVVSLAIYLREIMASTEHSVDVIAVFQGVTALLSIIIALASIVRADTLAIKLKYLEEKD